MVSELDSPFSPPNISNGVLSFSKAIKPEWLDFEPTSGLDDDLGITSGDALNVNPAAPSGVLDGDATGPFLRVEVLVVDGGVTASVARVVGVACGEFNASDVI